MKQQKSVKRDLSSIATLRGSTFIERNTGTSVDKYGKVFANEKRPLYLDDVKEHTKESIGPSAEISNADSAFNKVLAYKMPERVKHVAEEKFNIDPKETNSLWGELKKYLALNVKYGNVSMFSENIDKVWHAFILDLKEYVKFSDHIGTMLMHTPCTKEDRTTTSNNVAEFSKFKALYNTEFGELPRQWIVAGKAAYMDCKGEDSVPSTQCNKVCG